MEKHTWAMERADIGGEELEAGAAVGRDLLRLNNAHATELSWLEAGRFRQLVGRAFVAWRVCPARALLLAFDQAAEYDSPNFLWFRARLPRFVYVDRVVVAAEERGRGLGRALYGALFEAAVRAGHDRVVCEVNSDPPNPVSDAFHAALGFTGMGAAVLPGGKAVQYMVRVPLGRER